MYSSFLLCYVVINVLLLLYIEVLYGCVCDRKVASLNPVLSRVAKLALHAPTPLQAYIKKAHSTVFVQMEDKAVLHIQILDGAEISFSS